MSYNFRTGTVTIDPPGQKPWESLYKAANLIQERGWRQGSWSYNGPLCVEAAMSVAMGVNLFELRCTTAYRELRRYVGMKPFVWNDKHAKNKREVVSTLRSCALQLRIKAGDLPPVVPDYVPESWVSKFKTRVKTLV